VLASLVASLLIALNGPPCPTVPVYQDGRVSSYVCEDAAAQAGLTVLDLSAEWTPRLFTETPDLPHPYRPTLVALANERLGTGKEWDTARRDRYYELFGISPSFAIIGARLADDARHACHDGAGPVPSARAVRALQAHLRCDGLLPASARDGVLDPATVLGLALFQRKHMLPSQPAVDQETREALLAGSRELDFRTLLRALRERVVDAGGLIEDGSAANAWKTVLGRQIDSAEYRTTLRREPLPRAAPDLIASATEAAARTLGWTSPQAARQAFAGAVPGRVALRLPSAPPYHHAGMVLRAEIDRGDVWADYPFDAAGSPLRSPARRRPTLVIYARTNDGDVALVRWPTTIGSWKDEGLDQHATTLQYKPSPTGRRVWRDLVASPAWFPPPTTPDRELVRWRPESGWTPDDDAVGPGYRSAYGLVALLHHRPLQGQDPSLMADEQIRTHGSGNYRSILRGSSHGCHRLFNHLAVRLGSFLLAHHEYVRHGALTERYARPILWKGRKLIVRAENRGYRYELVPPVVVDVLPGRRVHSPARRGGEVSLVGR
jgi:hypothetical protein